MTRLSVRANNVIESARLLDEAAANARAFRYLVEDLNRRATAAGEELHAEALTMVRAAILRAEISAVTAIFDRWGGNRASLGYVVEELKDSNLRKLLTSRRRQTAIPGKFDELEQHYEAIYSGPLLERVRRPRNESIAHLLRADSRAPKVQYEDIFNLENKAEQLVKVLFDGLGCGEPGFVGHRDMFLDRAGLFWDTYFSGMREAKTKGGVRVRMLIRELQHLIDCSE